MHNSCMMQCFFFSLSAVVLLRRPPPFESAGHSFNLTIVNKTTSDDSQISYKIRAVPADCAFGFPLLEVGFMQVTEIFVQNLHFSSVET